MAGTDQYEATPRQQFKSGRELINVVKTRREESQAFKALAQDVDAEVSAGLDQYDPELIDGVRVLWITEGTAARDETAFRYALKAGHRLRAASRERREREHQAALEQARNQTTLTLRTRPEELTDAARVVREFTAALRTGAQIPITPEHRELIAAMREFSDLIAAQTAPAAPVLNRQQHRARKHTR